MKKTRLKEYKNGTWITETYDCDICEKSEEILKKRKQKENSKSKASGYNNADTWIMCFFGVALATSVALNVYQYVLMRSFLQMIK